MFRQVVQASTLPKEAELVRPKAPYYTIPVKEIIESQSTEGKQISYPQEVKLIARWNMDKSARLIGETKSMGKGKMIAVRDCPELDLVPCWVAWYSSKHGIKVYQYERTTYIRRDSDAN